MATTQTIDEDDRDEWDNVEPLPDDDSDSSDAYVVCVADADADGAKFKRGAFLAYSDKNAKFQAYYAVKDSYSRPKVYYCERVAEDV